MTDARTTNEIEVLRIRVQVLEQILLRICEMTPVDRRTLEAWRAAIEAVPAERRSIAEAGHSLSQGLAHRIRTSPVQPTRVTRKPEPALAS